VVLTVGDVANQRKTGFFHLAGIGICLKYQPLVANVIRFEIITLPSTKRTREPIYFFKVIENINIKITHAICLPLKLKSRKQ
jgi:hypothetical protein